MNIIDAVKKMKILPNPEIQTVTRLLNNGYHILLCDINNYQSILIKYDLFIRGGILYAAKTSDSTRDRIVLTPELAALYSDDLFSRFLADYLQKKDVLMVDVLRFMDSADINTGDYSLDSIAEHVRKTQDIYLFNDIFASWADSVISETVNFYFIDVLPGAFDVFKDITSRLPNAKLVSSIATADISVLPMPTQLTDSNGRIFQGCLLKDLPPIIRTTRVGKELLPFSIMFNIGNFMNIYKNDSTSALLQASSELDTGIKEYLKIKNGAAK